MTPEETAKAALAEKRAAANEKKLSSVLDWEPDSNVPRPTMNIWQKLAWVQKRIVVPKARGKGYDKNAKVEYAFRNASDILTIAKPLCFAVDAMVTADTVPHVFAENAQAQFIEVRKPYDKNKECSTMAQFGGAWRLLLAKAVFTDIETGEQYICQASAEQDNWRKGQSEPEKRSGSTDSYATKYALCHLFAIDDNADADSLSNQGIIGRGANAPSCPTATSATPAPTF